MKFFSSNRHILRQLECNFFSNRDPSISVTFFKPKEFEGNQLWAGEDEEEAVAAEIACVQEVKPQMKLGLVHKGADS